MSWTRECVSLSFSGMPLLGIAYVEVDLHRDSLSYRHCSFTQGQAQSMWDVEGYWCCRQKIEDLAGSLKFPLKKLFVIDGSTRSAHSNAYM